MRADRGAERVPVASSRAQRILKRRFSIFGCVVLKFASSIASWRLHGDDSVEKRNSGVGMLSLASVPCCGCLVPMPRQANTQVECAWPALLSFARCGRCSKSSHHLGRRAIDKQAAGDETPQDLVCCLLLALTVLAPRSLLQAPSPSPSGQRSPSETCAAVSVVIIAVQDGRESIAETCYSWRHRRR